MDDETTKTDDTDLQRYHFRKRPPSQEISKQKKPIKRRQKKAKKAAVLVAPPFDQEDSLDLADEEHDSDIMIKDEPLFDDEEEQQYDEMEREEEEETHNYFEEVRLEDEPMLANICSDVNLDEESDPLGFSYPPDMFHQSPSSNLPHEETIKNEDSLDSSDENYANKHYTQTFFIKKEKDPDPPIQIKKEKQEIESDYEDNLDNAEIPNNSPNLSFSNICDINKIKSEPNQEFYSNSTEYESKIHIQERGDLDNNIDPLASAPVVENTNLNLEDMDKLRGCQVSNPETTNHQNLLSICTNEDPNVLVHFYETNNQPNPFSKSDMLEKIASQLDPNSPFCQQVIKITSKKPRVLTNTTSSSPSSHYQLLGKEEKLIKAAPHIYIHKGVLYKNTSLGPAPKKEEAKLIETTQNEPGETTESPITSTEAGLNQNKVPTKLAPGTDQASLFGLPTHCNVGKNAVETNAVGEVAINNVEQETTIWGRFEKSKGLLKAANWVPVEGTSNGVVQQYRKVENTNIKNTATILRTFSIPGGTYYQISNSINSTATQTSLISPALEPALKSKSALPSILSTQNSKIAKVNPVVESSSNIENPPTPVLNPAKKGRKQELKPRLETSTESKQEDKSIHKPRKQTLKVNNYTINDDDDEEIYISCKNCKKSFSKLQTYNIHRQPYERNIENKFCKLCEEQCSSPCEILTHYIYHTTVDKVNFCILTRWDFMNSKAHVLDYIRLFDGCGVGSFICLCRRRFDFRRQLISHVEKYYSFCKNIVPVLRKRITIKSEEKPVKTVKIKETFVNHNDQRKKDAKEKRDRFKLAQYYTQQKKEKYSVCRKCKLQFENRCVYLEHVRFEHNEIYYCQHCRFFAKNGNKLKLQSHIIRYHLHKPKITAAKVYLIDD